MLRLAHRITAQVGTPLYAEWQSVEAFHKKTFKHTKEDVATMPVFCIDNVFEYFRSSDKEFWNFHEDFPTPVPPFERLFVEWNAGDDDGPFIQYGWDFRSFRGKWPIIGDLFRHEGCARLRENLQPSDVAVGGTLFVANERGLPMFAGGLCLFMLDSEGDLKDKPYFTAIVPGSDGDKMLQVTSSTFAVAIFSFSLMNCPSVNRIDATATAGPSEKWLRRQRQPTIRYHILDINPMKEVLRTEGRVESQGLKKALHDVRGHFARYTKERPLFGKYVGTVWVPEHKRGDAKNGIVVKDYNVNAPK